jgi:ribosomal-protein-serine acetyltransferase
VSAGPRLTQPDPPLADDLIRLEPLAQRHALPLLDVIRDDEDVPRFTRIPDNPDEEFVRSWIRRYENGWDDGTCAAFAILSDAGELIGFAGLVYANLDAREAEIGYVVGRQARGRGVATRSLGLLSRWSFDELGLERLELMIQPENTGSERVAERAGYRFEGVLRSKQFKDGRRADFGVWSLLPDDRPLA